MAKGRIRHMFSGGNTSRGFYSFFDYILPQDQAQRIFILKGGPGVGKSTFMKKIAEDLCNEGYDAEYIHCSSDPSSLDAVVFPRKKAAIIDGTSPHIVDPKNPGAVDEIINLGRFWDNDGLTRNRERIIETNAEISRLFRRAYRYLQAGYSLYSDNEAIYSRAMDHGKANRVISEITDVIFRCTDVPEKEGRQRHLFVSAITPEGLVNFLSSVITTKTVICIKGNPGTGTERLLERVRECSAERGLYTESYYCAFNPQKLEHVVIPELDVAVTTANEYHNAGVNPALKTDFNDFLDDYIVERNREAINFNKSGFEMLLNKAIETLKQAKEKHDELEKLYIPNMNYDEIRICREEILERLLQLNNI